MLLSKQVPIVLSIIVAGTTASRSTCKCGPTDSCWPAAREWAVLNATVGGRLIATVPAGSPCHTATQLAAGNSTTGSYNATACEAVQSDWHDPTFHEESSSSIMAPSFASNSCNPFSPASTPCVIGSYVRYAINVTEKAHVVAGLNFVNRHNIRLVIRNTGHE